MLTLVLTQDTYEQDTQLLVEVETVTFHNSENGWTVLKARECKSYLTLTAVGNFIAPHPGETFMVFGRWSQHVSFGKQFKINRFVTMQPQTKEGMIRYLSSGIFKGMGEKTAEKIVKHFGLQTFKTLDETPQKIKTIPKFSKKTANKIIEAWEEKKHISQALIFLHNHGISPMMAQKIIRIYGQETIAVVTQNPYVLIKNIHGLGFLTADRIARSIGIAHDAPQRIQQGIYYQLQMGEDKGHCFLTEDQLINSLAKTLDLSTSIISQKCEENLSTLIEQNLIVVKNNSMNKDVGTLQQRHFFPLDLYRAELEICGYFNHLLVSGFSKATFDPTTESSKIRIENWLNIYCEKTSNSLSDDQRQAVFRAATHKVFILTGGPGVGKTTTANAIIQLFKAMGKKIALAAPTGRAAQRMQEVSQMPAKTIHRLLEWSPDERGFKRDEDNPLAADVVIIDEASMIDARMGQSLLKAIPSTAQMIWIGDVDQLPSVGAGNVLRDVITSDKIPYVRLSQIFRQASASHIIQAAHKINQGETPTFSNEAESDCRFIEAESADEIIEKIKALLTEHLPNAGYHPVRDIQILTPMNRGDLGSIRINQEIQKLLNPDKESLLEESKTNTKATLTFRPKDKVIQTSNNYDLLVFNGDIGYVEHTKVEGGKTIVSFADRKVNYEHDDTFDLSLAYAITIHKSQGSEFPVVIIPISMSHYIMLQRNLIYTALTRAKKLAIFVGHPKALHLAINNPVSLARQTELQQYLVSQCP